MDSLDKTLFGDRNLFTNSRDFFTSPLHGVLANSITAEDLPMAVLPLVSYIAKKKPDCVIACDRGARPIGFATFILYKELHGTFPTYDGTIKFRKLSKKNSLEENFESLISIGDELIKTKEKPSVLILDDWITSGQTKTAVLESFDFLSVALSGKKNKFEVEYKTLFEYFEKIYPNFASSAEWNDRPEFTGVDYKGITPYVVQPGDCHRDYRKRIVKATKSLVEKINSSKSFQ